MQSRRIDLRLKAASTSRSTENEANNPLLSSPARLRYPLQKQSSEYTLTQHATEFPKSKEGYQRNSQDNSGHNKLSRTSVSHLWHTFRKRLSLPQTADDRLSHIKEDEHHRQHDRLVQNGINQRFLPKLGGKV